MEVIKGFDFPAVNINSVKYSEKTGERLTYSLANIDGTLSILRPCTWNYVPVTDEDLKDIHELAAYGELTAAIKTMDPDHEMKKCEDCEAGMTKYSLEGREHIRCLECAKKIERPDFVKDILGLNLESDSEG